MKAKLEMNEDLKPIEEAIIVGELLESFGLDLENIDLMELTRFKFEVKNAVKKQMNEINENR